MRLGSTYSSFLDAEDVVQSVLRSFLRRAGEGKFQLRDPAQLVRLLTQMARNKAFTALRREGRRKSLMQDDELTDLTDPREASDESVSRQELIELYRRHMGSAAWQVLQWRLDGYTWSEIARRTQESPEVLRKRLQRVLECLRENLPLE
jgi:RNA polymerase sigma factor (sigma-70 family)